VSRQAKELADVIVLKILTKYDGGGGHFHHFLEKIVEFASPARIRESFLALANEVSLLPLQV